MTYKEKFIKDHPNWSDRELEDMINGTCPDDYYDGASCECLDTYEYSCECCWNNKIPEVANNEDYSSVYLTPEEKARICREECKDNPVVEYRKSKWEICSDGYYPYCPKCMKEPASGIMTKYCPNCGEFMG